MSANVDGLSVDGLRVSGLLPHSSWAAEVVERYGVPGSMDAARVLESRVTGGFDHEVLASRGLDIGYAAWRGVPLAWRSP
ncbi:MAG: aldose 1-epimerase family protein, partial [Humibacter sp.]